jgi:NADP-dependent 3-hydroxy acid dehydrogenase YdfG
MRCGRHFRTCSRAAPETSSRSPPKRPRETDLGEHELRERGVRCTNVCPGGVATDFAMGRGRTPGMPELEGMMTAEDVAEVVLFALTRPRTHRILETAFRPMTEASWG